MVKKIRRKVKKIAMKASLTTMELEDLTEENEIHKKTLAEDFKKEFAFIEWKNQQERKKVEQELQEQEQSSEKEPEPEESEIEDDETLEKDAPPDTPSELKKLYRAIAQKTHPDKTNDERLNEIFKLSADAANEKNWMALVEFAGELNLDIEFLSDEACVAIEQSIENNQKKINGIKNTFSYIWACQKDDNDRSLFRLMFYQHFGINKDEYDKWLKEHP
tara:strand:- start:94 stop:750 length:657 start_codon:yes stop_codon:yes gene_type:complete